ncbi:P-loop NTPase family protein [Desulfocicer niacini]
MRIVIFGNSGSGKTWLAKKMSFIYSMSIVHFDEIFWEPGGFDKKRESNEILSLINESKKMSSWVAEGVFGKIAEHFIENTDIIIWLDIPLEICIKRLGIRGSESKKHMNREESEQGLKELIEWASQYYDRKNLNSYSGHRKLFNDFSKQKFRLRSESDVHEFLKTQSGSRGF